VAQGILECLNVGSHHSGVQSREVTV
jgi:hypothetical protein